MKPLPPPRGLATIGVLLASASCFSASRPSEETVVEEALEAIAVCVHWAGEEPYDAEREGDITEGVERDCPNARAKASVAYEKSPGDSRLAEALLTLHDVGYFDLSEEQRSQLCDTAFRAVDQRSDRRMEEGSVPGALCPDQVDKISKKNDAHLRALVAVYDSLWQTKDLAGVGRLLAPDYTYFTSTGGLSSRAETLEFLRDPTYHLVHVRRSDVDVTMVGPVARVISRWEGRGEYRGSPVLDDQTCGQIWVWREARWQLFSEHCVNRPESDSTSATGG